MVKVILITALVYWLAECIKIDEVNDYLGTIEDIKGYEARGLI